MATQMSAVVEAGELVVVLPYITTRKVLMEVFKQLVVLALLSMVPPELCSLNNEPPFQVYHLEQL